MSSLKVKINIAGRFYPLTINAEEEEAVRNAGKEINRLVQEFEDRYAVTDKQGAISMVALQMASKLNLLKQSGEGSDQELNEKVSELTEFIERELEQEN
ncbi:MAG: cell division protein ZapA [Flavobacteriia bacterium]|nr:cell division protein ZapA [Flavobacteriia bacterium]